MFEVSYTRMFGIDKHIKILGIDFPNKQYVTTEAKLTGIYDIINYFIFWVAKYVKRSIAYVAF